MIKNSFPLKKGNSHEKISLLHILVWISRYLNKCLPLQLIVIMKTGSLERVWTEEAEAMMEACVLLIRTFEHKGSRYHL